MDWEGAVSRVGTVAITYLFLKGDLLSVRDM